MSKRGHHLAATWFGLSTSIPERVALISLSPPRGEDQVGSDAPAVDLRMGRQAPRACMGPAGANGSLRVSMYQMAVAMARATSTRATFGPALLAEALLRALVGGPERRRAGGMDGRLDEGPAQVLRTVLGQRPAVVPVAGLADERAEPGVADELLTPTRSG